MLQYWCRSLYSELFLSPKIRLKADMKTQMTVFKQIEKNFLQKRVKNNLPVFQLVLETETRVLLVDRKYGILLGLTCKSQETHSWGFGLLISNVVISDGRFYQLCCC